ncbi:LOW QUALITY PROTEIN: coiled-coil domain-containing protein 115 [Electrophorus electricus]|uniref:LOW QUALITY PROTEIN: coiled-coil domain-containing protein 115 n=1 Tax=Electrophorus electricus TaxID=8005 RepID=UPI0015CFF992|nr:LOW QUALITY PROTEIN: coiled-coil domain-containing protein 115 [Electrophorus electricus]
MSLDPASLRIDQRLLYFMDQLEILEEKRQKLNALIEEGWFNISKARYSMGNKQVSALQYASEMDPHVYVNTSIDKNGVVEFQCEQTEHKAEEPKESDTVENMGPTEGGLRRRMNVRQKETEDESTAKGQHEEERQVAPKAEKAQCPLQEPLKWFGILVPQNLKQAQTVFKEVITLSAEISTLQNVILVTREELQSQMKEKQKISLN